MTDFAHVANLTLRRVLMRQEGGDAVADALAFTSDCLLRDAGDLDIPYRIVDARREALDEASGWWNDEGNEWEAVEALRRCWSV
jgi:hypothetical protein